MATKLILEPIFEADFRDCSKLYWDLDKLIEGLNPKLQGFKNYCSISPIAKRWLNRIDWYTIKRLTIFRNKKRNKRNKHSGVKEVLSVTKDLLIKLAG